MYAQGENRMKNLEITVKNVEKNTMKNYSFSTGIHSVGRIEGNAIVVDSPKVSREHAVFVVKPNGTFIQDKNSKFGTFVDNRMEIKKFPKLRFILEM